MRNPLLDVRFTVPFDQIRAEHVEPAVQELLKDAQAGLDRIAQDEGPRTFRNTLTALDDSTERLDYAMGVVRHLEAVATYPELRAAYNAVQPPVSEFYSLIPLNEKLWHALKAFSATEEARGLAGARKRFLSKTIDNFRRHGAELPPHEKERLAAIDIEISKLTTKFSENVLDSTNAFELVIDDERKLAGLPPSAIAIARQDAKRKGVAGWRFTLHAPSYLAVMTYLDDAEIRERLYRAYATRAASGQYDNGPLIRDILRLRQEKAVLLGYGNFADLVLEDRMAHNGKRAMEFLAGLQEKTEARFDAENAALHAFREQLEGRAAKELQAWDIAYYAEKQRQALYDFDEESLRPYFALPRVIAGMFEIAGRLYGIRVTECSGAPVWHSDTTYYEVHDEDGAFVGAFYADWFPRENKRGGAWMDALLTGGPTADEFKPHLGLICGNLTPPIGSSPALLTHREVETIFHEFGHLLHHLLSRVEIRSLSGTSVAWDFVELPSQIMENWCWEREALDLFARHYQSSEVIPEELFIKIRRAKNFRSANAQMRQLGFGIADLKLHMEYPPQINGNPIAYTRDILQRFSPAPLPPDHAMIAAFTHLFSGPVGYGAGYYSYKWAEVLDADAFTRFREGGIFSRETGSHFRDNILARGDSEDPALLYRQFMGRDPDLTALLVRSGLLEP
jgi:oligopeptidase A